MDPIFCQNIGQLAIKEKNVRKKGLGRDFPNYQKVKEFIYINKQKIVHSSVLEIGTLDYISVIL